MASTAAADRNGNGALDRWVKLIGVTVAVVGFVAVIVVKMLSADFVTRDALAATLDQREVAAEKVARERQDAVNRRLDELTQTMRDVHQLLLNDRGGKK
jgi:CHASE1-domain containing sensor protein